MASSGCSPRRQHNNNIQAELPSDAPPASGGPPTMPGTPGGCPAAVRSLPRWPSSLPLPASTTQRRMMGIGGTVQSFAIEADDDYTAVTGKLEKHRGNAAKLEWGQEVDGLIDSCWGVHNRPAPAGCWAQRGCRAVRSSLPRAACTVGWLGWTAGARPAPRQMLSGTQPCRSPACACYRPLCNHGSKRDWCTA